MHLKREIKHHTPLTKISRTRFIALFKGSAHSFVSYFQILESKSDMRFGLSAEEYELIEQTVGLPLAARGAVVCKCLLLCVKVFSKLCKQLGLGAMKATHFPRQLVVIVKSFQLSPREIFETSASIVYQSHFRVQNNSTPQWACQLRADF